VIIVLDLGTSIVKGGILTPDGKLLVKQSIPVSLYRSKDPLYQEINPSDWNDAIYSLIQQFSATDNLKNCHGIVITGNGPTLVPVGKNGEYLCPAMTWLDRRASKESLYIEKKTGISIDPSFYLPKILWLKNNRPEIYKKVRYFFSPAGFIAFHLTGESSMVFPGVGLENYVWTPELISLLDLDKEKFPSLISISDVAGKTTKKNRFAFPSGIPVFAGGPDFAMSILGTGTVQPGRGCDRAGTSEGINICSLKKIADRRLMSYRHVVRKYWNVTGIISTTGKALEWYKKELLPDFSFEDMYSSAGSVRKGSEKLIFLPYLTGERAPLWDTHIKGTFLGLSLHHGRNHMTRAVLESIGYAIRDVLEVMEENGVSTKDIRVAGSMSEIDLLNQIKADITGKPVLIPEISVSEFTGGLCTALYGLGYYNSLQEASETLVKIKRVFEPEKDRGIYDELFPLYREAYRSLKQLYEKLGKIET